jgi:class 3 adenylate cyclase
MAEEGFKRKLTAILSADVAGYSRLMGEDESATVKTLEAYKQVMVSLIKQNRGRVIDSSGDNILADFSSVVDAVQCGVAIQKELLARNADLPQNRKMEFRIGINLGDVIEEGDRIYGDGVNIAARLEALADPGGICVSKTAFDYIESKLPLGYRFLEEKSVKNIAKPIGAYKVLMDPRVIDGEEEEGFKTGHHVWADKYDRELEDIFSVQDEVTRKVVSELAVALTATESDRLPRKHTESFEAYDMYLRAKMEQYVHKKENTLKGIEICRRVIDLDPNFAGGYQLQSFLLSRGIRFEWFPREDLERAYELAQQTKSVDYRFPASYLALASVYLMQGKHDDALAAANRAASLVPGDSDTIAWLEYYLHWVGRGEEAVAAVKKSRELNPKYLSCGYPIYVDFMGQFCFTAGLYEESISNMKTAQELFGPSIHRYPFMIASYSMLGRMEEAKESVRQWLNVKPAFSLSSWNYGRLYKRSQDSERLYEALSKAGLK